MIRWLIFAILCASCGRMTCEKKEKRRVNDSNIKNRNIIQVNEVLYQDIKSKDYYYNIYHSCNISSKEKIVYKRLFNKKGKTFNKVDISSFKNMGTYWLDKYNFYYIHREEGTWEVTMYKLDSTDVTYFYQNSFYRLKNNKLDYFIDYSWESDSVINCSLDSNESIDIEEFHVLDMNYNLLQKNNCYINAYAVYKNNFLFHGCWIDLKKIDIKLKNKLLKLKNEKCYLEPFITGNKKRTK